MSKELNYEVGSGNVFADLGLPDAEELKAKALLVIEIIQIIEARGLKQAEAAEIMGIDQPKVSQLVRGKLDGFSMERLYRFLNALGRDIEIVVTPKPKSRKEATLSVTGRESVAGTTTRRSENARPGISAEIGPEVEQLRRKQPALRDLQYAEVRQWAAAPPAARPGAPTRSTGTTRWVEGS